MHEDLLFHITTNKHWKRYKMGGKYKPESLEAEGLIHLSNGRQVEKTANLFFAGENEILLVVIDTARLGEDLKYEKDAESGESYPHLHNALDMGAVIEKIRVRPEDDGTFKIAFSSDS